MVGEHDEPVGAGGVGAGPGDPGDLAIEIAEHGEAVLAFDPGVVRHLVVGEKGRVDRRPSGEDVADHRGDLQVALNDGRPGADQGIGTTAPDPRPDVIAHLCARRAPLSDHVDEDEDERLRDGVGAREVGRVVAADRPAPVQRRAHRQHRVRGVAGEDVGATGAVRVQEAATIGVPPLELLGIARVVGDDRRASILLPPAEGRHVLVRAMKQSGLAGAGLGGPVGLPALQGVRSGLYPRRQVRSAVLGERPLEHVVREPVDLEKRHTGNLGLDQGLPPAKLAAHHVPVPGVVFVDRQQREDAAGDGSHHDRHHDSLQDSTDLRIGEKVDCESDEQAVQNEPREPEREHGERQCQTGERRPYEGVE